MCEIFEYSFKLSNNAVCNLTVAKLRPLTVSYRSHPTDCPGFLELEPHNQKIVLTIPGRIQRGGETWVRTPSPGKSQVVIGFLVWTPSRGNWTPWVQLPLEGGPYGPLRNTLIHVWQNNEKKELSGLPLAEFSGFAHIINNWTSYFQLCVCLEFSLFLFNPYKTSVLFVARRQTVQT